MKNLCKFISIVTIFFIFSCRENSERNSLRRSIQKNIGKPLFIPETIRMYHPFLKVSLDSVKLAESNLKIYSMIDASCPTCIDNVIKWSNFFDYRKYGISVILICTSIDNFELLKYLCETKRIRDFPFPFFLDNSNAFLTNNKFMKEHKHMETILTDRDNTILLMGNPFHSAKIKQMYLKEIK